MATGGMTRRDRLPEVLGELFGVPKPIIGMAHFPPLPGTPLYDEAAGIEGILDRVRDDVAALCRGGVDGLLFCNEGDRPYSFQAPLEAVAVMSRVVSQVAPRDRPFGVDYLWDARAAIAVAHATGARFAREVFSGTYESDMGLWSPDAASLLRYRRQIDAAPIRLFFNILPEFASPLGDRPLGVRARSAVFSSLADVLLISGMAAGVETDLERLAEVKQAVGGEVPVLANTGVRLDNVTQYLEVADGAIVGSSFKREGNTWNPVDDRRVEQFMDAVRALRGRA
jgi:membrane complex biogenesis BtpA family protein